MGLVLWIDKNKFVTGLLEKIYKEEGLAFYTLSSVRDFAYLVDDLKPEAIVLDTATARDELELFRKQYEASLALQAVPIITLGEESELEFVKNFKGRIPRPFDPFRIPEILKTVVAELR